DQVVDGMHSSASRTARRVHGPCCRVVRKYMPNSRWLAIAAGGRKSRAVAAYPLPHPPGKQHVRVRPQAGGDTAVLPCRDDEVKHVSGGRPEVVENGLRGLHQGQVAQELVNIGAGAVLGCDE